VPDIGDFKDVAVIELLVKPGDTIKAEQSLITVESDKASMEIPSSHAGVVQGAEGQARRQGGRRLGVLLLEAAGAQTAAPQPPQHPHRNKNSLLRQRQRGHNPLSVLNHLPPPSRPPSPARPTWSATCWCSAAALAATRPPSARPTWA
jgi:pyruvate/2-oxoglutarate dehydrogenase complex dihydrolipoamide acyltransferase (E2) component